MDFKFSLNDTIRLSQVNNSNIKNIEHLPVHAKRRANGHKIQLANQGMCLQN